MPGLNRRPVNVTVQIQNDDPPTFALLSTGIKINSGGGGDP